MQGKARAHVKAEHRDKHQGPIQARSADVWTVLYDIQGEKIQGTAQGMYLMYGVEEEDGEVSLQYVRGFLHFKGEINGQAGEFLAQEQGALQRDSLNMNGNVIDATEEFMLLTGNYHYDRPLSAQLVEVSYHFNM